MNVMLDPQVQITAHSSAPPVRDTPAPRINSYSWCAADVETMPEDAFLIWWEASVAPAILVGLQGCPSPSRGGSKTILVAAKKRAAAMGLYIPAPRTIPEKAIAINAPKLAAACKRKARGRTLYQVGREADIDASTLFPIFAGQRKFLYHATLEAVCAWLGERPAGFQV